MMRDEDYEVRNKESYLDRSVNVMFTQMSAKKGIRMFGEKAVAAMVKEFTQLDKGAMPGKQVIQPINVKDMVGDERKMALEAVNLIDNKRSGKIKGRTCADGSKQKLYLNKEESISSPTVSVEALFTTLAIDAFEGRKVSTFDVPGAYLHAKMPPDKQILLKLRGEFVDIMCNVNEQHRPNIVIENGKKVLYMRVKRAIYGCIESALLWYDLFTTTLQGMGFKVNDYDRCIATKQINGKQCTICWYVDDNKISHMDQEVIDEVINKLKPHFGKLTITRGDTHTFLGMDIKIRNDGKFEILQTDHLKEAFEMFGEDLTRKVTSSASSYLFQVDNNSKMLDDTKSKVFHSVSAKLLFVMQRLRPDIETSIEFMCSRVSKITNDYWRKLKRVLQWLYHTIDKPQIIGASSLTELFTWVDSAFAVHPDMRSQPSGCMSLG
jgi:Ca2+-binding EF-hand superfamily protein